MLILDVLMNCLTYSFRLNVQRDIQTAKQFIYKHTLLVSRVRLCKWRAISKALFFSNGLPTLYWRIGASLLPSGPLPVVRSSHHLHHLWYLPFSLSNKISPEFWPGFSPLPAALPTDSRMQLSHYFLDSFSKSLTTFLFRFFLIRLSSENSLERQWVPLSPVRFHSWTISSYLFLSTLTSLRFAVFHFNILK